MYTWLNIGLVVGELHMWKPHQPVQVSQTFYIYCIILDF